MLVWLCEAVISRGEGVDTVELLEMGYGLRME